MTREQCSATTRAGARCRQPAAPGSEFCATHLRGPSVLTDELTERFCGYLRAGAYIATALRAVSVAKGTFDTWMARGRSDKPSDELYREFRGKVRQAQATSEVVNVARIARAGDDDWHAAAWLLERTHPERYGPPATRLRLDQPLPVTPIDVPEEADPFAEFDELAAQRVKRGT